MVRSYFRIILTYLLAQKTKTDHVKREASFVEFIEFLFADRRDILANAIDDNESMAPLINQLTRELTRFLHEPMGPFSRGVLEATIGHFLRRVENASRMATEKVKYAVSDHYRWFDQERIQPRKHSFCRDWRLRIITTYVQADRGKALVPGLVTLALGFIKYHTELAWKLSSPNSTSCVEFITMFAQPVQERIYGGVGDALGDEDINPFSLRLHLPHLTRLLPNRLAVTSRHLTPRLLNSAELSIYEEFIAGRLDSKNELVNELLTDYGARCAQLNTTCLNQSNGLDKCTTIGAHFYALIRPLINAQPCPALPLCANSALLAQFYQDRHDLRLEWARQPFWSDIINRLLEQLGELSTSLPDKDLSHNVCEHLCRILRLCWDFERFFACDDNVAIKLNDIITQFLSRFGSKRAFREASSSFFSDMMRQMFL